MKREQLFLLVQATIWFIFPLLNLFVLPRSWFASSPFNASYRHMMLAVFVGISLTDCFLAFRIDIPNCFFRDFQTILSLAFSILWGATSVFGETLFWILVFLSLLAFRIVNFSKDIEHFKQWKLFIHFRKENRDFRMVALSLGLQTLPKKMVMFGVLMWLGPTFAPWDGPAAFVRWYPLNLKDELVWRGIFFTTALFMFITATNPQIHQSFLFYLIVHGFIHASVMLIDNLRDLDGNGNPEHLYGDIGGWYFISFMVALLGFRLDWLRRPKEKLRTSEEEGSKEIVEGWK